ncbi:MAG: hypothetical protein AAFN74_05565 [Myxococcota bacterium]
MTALRLMVYDRTCRGRGPLPGLTLTWKVGGWLYRRWGRLDAVYGAASWAEALHWLASFRGGQKIGEIQFWGHGNWGCAKIAGESLDVNILDSDDPRHGDLDNVRRRLNPNSLWWFRTCETFGRQAGHEFAKRFADYLDSRVAGHTYVIHWAQSGLHSIGPGQTPRWSTQEGVHADGRRRGLWSSFSSPNTVSCLHGTIPEGW